MPRYEVTGPDGHKYAVTAPEGVSQADVMAKVRAEAEHPAADSKPATPSAPATKPVDESAAGIFSGAVKDTFGVSDRPGRVTMTTNRPGDKTPLGVVVDPQNAGESLLMPAITAPAYGKMPGGALGRVALAAGLGGGTSALRGEGMSSSIWRTLIDGAVAGVTEGMGGYLGRKAGEKAADLIGREAAFKHATEAPQQALDFIRDRLPKGKWLDVPSIAKGAKVTAQEAIDKLATLEGDAYRVAREEIVANLDKLDVRKVAKLAPYAGRIFRMLTGEQRFAPKAGSVAEKSARAVAEAATNPAARGAADALTTGPLPGDAMSRGEVVGAGALGAGSSVIGKIARHALGQGMLP